MKPVFKFVWLPPVVAAIVVTACKPQESEYDPGTEKPRLLVVDFEHADDYLAGPTSYGENLYSAAGDDQYVGYYDAASDLVMPINESYGSFDFWNGGIAVSRWNEMTVNSYANQCSVYYSDPVTGFGGHNGSKTFAVHNGYEGAWSSPSEIFFLDENTERTFDSFWVCNSTYACLTATLGNDLARPLDVAHQDYLRVVVRGFDKSGLPTGSAEYYPVDFRTSTSPGVATGWRKVDLRPLGAVHRLQLSVEGSDVTSGELNTPAYFCFDDMAIIAD
jgi:hypothetical protein